MICGRKVTNEEKPFRLFIGTNLSFFFHFVTSCVVYCLKKNRKAPPCEAQKSSKNLLQTLSSVVKVAEK
jgi:hypothetical protein